MKGTFLGTASMVPTKQRNVSSVYVEVDGHGLLLDCGEGTQRQMTHAGLNRHRVKTILISHWHGDHVSGLVGLLQTKDKVPNPENVLIVGPQGTERHIKHLLQSCVFNLDYEVRVKEVVPSNLVTVLDSKVVVKAAQLRHGIPCLGFTVQQRSRRRVDMESLQQQGVPPGKHIGELQRGEDIEWEGETYTADKYTYTDVKPVLGYTVDTRPCDGMHQVANAADTLISEATFLKELLDRAKKYYHLTAEEAAKVALQEDVKELYLTHFSQRYPDTAPLTEEAEAVFANTICAKDFLEFEL